MLLCAHHHHILPPLDATALLGLLSFARQTLSPSIHDLRFLAYFWLECRLGFSPRPSSAQVAYEFGDTTMVEMEQFNFEFFMTW